LAKIDIELFANIEKATRDIAEFSRQTATLLEKVESGFSSFGDKAGKATEKAGQGISRFSAGLGGAGAAIVVANQALELLSKGFDVLASAVSATVGEYREYEKQLVAVSKTTNIQGAGLAKLGEEFRNLSEVIPVSARDLAEIAAAAGQLGVEEKDLLNFTETIARLGKTTNISGEEAAVGLARILNASGEATDRIDELAAVIVDLGNNSAASEKDLVRLTTEISRGLGNFRVSSTDSAALAAALRSIGVQAELAGSSLTRTFIDISLAVNKNGNELKILQQITGKTGEVLKKEFSENSIGVFRDFLGGLQRLKASGQDVNVVLQAFGLRGTEIAKVIPPLVSILDKYDEAQARANEQVKNATALLTESEIAFRSLDSRMIILNNSITNISSVIGQAFAPALVEAANFLFCGLSQLPKRLYELLCYLRFSHLYQQRYLLNHCSH